MIKPKSLPFVCSLALISTLANAAKDAPVTTVAPASKALPAPKTPIEEPTAAQEDGSEVRHASLRRGSTLDGSTGLLRLRSADSGAVGTMRLSLGGSFYSGSSFLCPP